MPKRAAGARRSRRLKVAMASARRGSTFVADHCGRRRPHRCGRASAGSRDGLACGTGAASSMAGFRRRRTLDLLRGSVTRWRSRPMKAATPWRRPLRRHRCEPTRARSPQLPHRHDLEAAQPGKPPQLSQQHPHRDATLFEDTGRSTACTLVQSMRAHCKKMLATIIIEVNGYFHKPYPSGQGRGCEPPLGCDGGVLDGFTPVPRQQLVQP